jgi:hypothetical protein
MPSLLTGICEFGEKEREENCSVCFRLLFLLLLPALLSVHIKSKLVTRKSNTAWWRFQLLDEVLAPKSWHTL